MRAFLVVVLVLLGGVAWFLLRDGNTPTPGPTPVLTAPWTELALPMDQVRVWSSDADDASLVFPQPPKETRAALEKTLEQAGWRELPNSSGDDRVSWHVKEGRKIWLQTSPGQFKDEGRTDVMLALQCKAGADENGLCPKASAVTP
jgi:hypothetical protein